MTTPYTAPMSPPEFALVPLTAIVTSPTNPRKSFDQDKLNELASTIKASGVHTPILLRYLPPARLQETFTDRKKGAKLPEYEIVAGERRYRASIIAGVATIPALIRAMSDQQALEVQMIENLQRDDLSELEEADGYQQLCELTNISKEAIAEKIGRSRRYVYDRLRLLKLQPLARTALAGGKISATAALAIATVHDGDLQAKALAHAMDVDYQGDHPSTRDLQRWMRQNVMLDLSKATFDIRLATLSPHAGACTTCPKRTGADPDLFAETQGPDMCCDAPCYHLKAEAASQATIAVYKAQGFKIIDADEAAKLHRYNDHFTGYSQVSQTREDTSSGKPATLLDLLGKKGQAAVGLVAIEHPKTKAVGAYVDTDKAEAWLEANGLLAAPDDPRTPIRSTPEEAFKHLLASQPGRVKEAGIKAEEAALKNAVLHAPARIIGLRLITDQFMRAFLMVNSGPYSTSVAAQVLQCERADDEKHADYPLRLHAAIGAASTVQLLRAFMLEAITDMQDRMGNEDEAAVDEAKAELYDTLKKPDANSLEELRDQAEEAETEAIQAEALALQAQIKPKKPSTPNAPLAQPKAGAGAKPKKAKLTKQEAQLGIADAMQGMAEVGADAPDSGNNVAADAAKFTKGQRVKVIAAGATYLEKWIGKNGKIKQACGDNFDVAFYGGGIAEFEPQELVAVA